MLGWECELEPQTKVREHFTIMENAPSRALSWLRQLLELLHFIKTLSTMLNGR